MKIRKKARLAPIVPINSMSDIAFLLLIFIIVISLINYRREEKIEYPEAENQEVTQADKNMEIWINIEGNVFYKGRTVDGTELENIIVDVFVKSPDTRIHLIADKNTPYKNVDKVLKILQLLQHRAVSLVVPDGDKAPIMTEEVN